MVDFTQSSNFTAAGSVDFRRTGLLAGDYRVLAWQGAVLLWRGKILAWVARRASPVCPP